MACSKPSTRSDTEIYLVGFTNDSILSARLPSRKQTLQNFFHQLEIYHKTVRESTRITIETVSDFSNKPHLPMTTMQHAIARLEKMYNELRNLQTAAKRNDATQKTKEKAFVKSLEKTFDISHVESEVLIQNLEDKAFLHAQLGGGRGTSSMAQVDNKLAIKIQRKKDRDAIKSGRLKVQQIVK